MYDTTLLSFFGNESVFQVGDVDLDHIIYRRVRDGQTKIFWIAAVYKLRKNINKQADAFADSSVLVTL